MPDAARTAEQMRQWAATVLDALDGEQRAQAALPFADDAARRWLEYRPLSRPGACLAVASPAARKAAHRLLSTALSDHGYAQAAVIMALEEVLDRREGWWRGRHSGDYWVSVFGDPAGHNPWSWRFEGHHLSVTMTVQGAEVSPAPIFLGANPAAVLFGDRPVSRPLGPEEDLGRELLQSLDAEQRAVATVGGCAPYDIRSATRPRAPESLQPRGIAAGALDATQRALLDELMSLYIGRLSPGLRAAELGRAGELHFAWEGPPGPGVRHYYRIQGDDLLIEYDNTTDDGNHAHTVLRRPRSDFGADLLAAHLKAER
jgi:Protein of unknown function (DUF3500)